MLGAKASGKQGGSTTLIVNRQGTCFTVKSNLDVELLEEDEIVEMCDSQNLPAGLCSVSEEIAFVSTKPGECGPLAPLIDVWQSDLDKLGHCLYDSLRTHGYARLTLSEREGAAHQRAMDVAQELFDLPAESLQSVNFQKGAHQPHFGYWRNGPKNKQIFKARLRPERRGYHWPSSPATFQAQCENTLSVFATLCHRVMTALTQHMGRPEVAAWFCPKNFGTRCRCDCECCSAPPNTASPQVDTQISGRCQNCGCGGDSGDDMFAETFGELFRYSDTHPPGSFVMPCEEHSDVGALTIIPTCQGSGGLEIYDWSQGDWQRVEPETRDAAQPVETAVLFAGDVLEAILPPLLTTMHRVVIPSGSTRISHVFEYLPNTCTSVTRGGIDGPKMFASELVNSLCVGRESVNTS